MRTNNMSITIDTDKIGASVISNKEIVIAFAAGLVIFKGVKLAAKLVKKAYSATISGVKSIFTKKASVEQTTADATAKA